jgi:hypothetical protein
MSVAIFPISTTWYQSPARVSCARSNSVPAPPLPLVPAPPLPLAFFLEIELCHFGLLFSGRSRADHRRPGTPLLRPPPCRPPRPRDAPAPAAPVPTIAAPGRHNSGRPPRRSPLLRPGRPCSGPPQLRRPPFRPSPASPAAPARGCAGPCPLLPLRAQIGSI